ncbi:unnamed protein product [Peronospora belbahrii]|nr:unnamed protein product [Peronospora belbahrii]
MNQYNVYHQVGLVAINLYGKPFRSFGKDEKVEIFHRNDKKMTRNVENWSFPIEPDNKITRRMEEIQSAKEKAVICEDYDQAKRLKEMEIQLKSTGQKLARLEAQKRKAVKYEEFDLAKTIKLEMERLEAFVESVNESEQMLPLPRVRANSLLMSQEVESVASGEMCLEPLQFAESEGSSGDKGNGSLRRSAQGSSLSGKKQDPCNGDNDTDQEDGNDEDLKLCFGKMPDAANLPDSEEISAELAKKSEELIAVFGPFLMRCFYSNVWNHRDAAIRKVTMEINNYPVEPIRLLEVCATLAQNGAEDGNVQVVLSAFGLLDRMVSFGASVCHDDMCRILGNSMAQLVNNLGGSQIRVRDKAVAVLEHLAAANNAGVAFVSSHLTKRSNTPLGLGIVRGRLLMLKTLLAKFELICESNFSAPSIIGFLEDTNSLTHQCREIRDTAKDIVVSLYLAIGAEVEIYLQFLQPKQLEEYQAAFETVEKAKVLNHHSSVTSASNGNGGIVRCNEKECEIQLRFELEVEDASDSEDKESGNEYTCPFCGVEDESCDSDFLVRHFWGSCKMLTPCKMCGQVIEIATLTEHLLVECEMRQNHRKCLRCGEAITTKFYERHVSLNDCAP